MKQKTRFLSILALLLMAVTGAWADDELYATVDGTAMTLKYGTLPASGATEYDGRVIWNEDFSASITTATVHESCKDYAGASLQYLFLNMANLTSISGLENLNTASVTDMESMFNSCPKLASLDLSKWNTASVTTTANMFVNCSDLTSVDLSGWNTAKVTDMSAMFGGCGQLATIKVGDGWNTDAVTSSDYMFVNCNSLPNFSSDTVDKTNAHTGTGGYLTAAAAAGPTTYSVNLASGTEDADKWTITPNSGLSEGDPVTIQYNGTRRIRSITAVVKEAEPAGNTVDLAALSADYEAQDGDVLTGTLSGNYKITIADRATVTLQGVTINGVNNSSYSWAGLNLAGDGTIILSGTNNVKGFQQKYPGIYVPVGKTVTIKGDGSLTASSNGWASGIGGGYEIACGNIAIEGGTISATGGDSAAGIGAGYGNVASCGNITITGGTITATGGYSAAGIGSGNEGSCGDITITDGVTKVTATKGNTAPNSIGKGVDGTCGTVTIGGTEGAISESPYTYDPSAPAGPTAYTLAEATVGMIVGTDGKAYNVADKDNLPSGVTAAGMVAYKNGSNGLAIQLNGSPVSRNWDNAKTYAAGLTAVPGCTWRLPSKEDWQNMFVGCAVSGDASAGDSMNPIAGFKNKIAATGITWQKGNYWSSSKSGSLAWYVLVSFILGSAATFNDYVTSSEYYVLGCLAF